MSSVTRLALVLILLSGLESAQWVFAQGTDLGTIQGTVKDASGAVIANAKVTVIDVDTNTPRETHANGAGDFEVFGLRSGRYKVSVTASGMNTEVIDDVMVNGSRTVGLAVTLRISSVAEKVEVTAQYGDH
jgi:Carboxypeptidase regulatory-like domain